MFVERDACSGVEDAAEIARHEVARDDLVLRVSQNALHRSLGGSFHRRLDLVVRRLNTTKNVLANMSRSRYVDMATQPVHRLQIRPIVHN